jgi:hypothetical protein
VRDHINVCETVAGPDALEETFQSRTESGECVPMHQNQRWFSINTGLNPELRFPIARAVEAQL